MTLKERLRKAEGDLLEALQESEPGHPLAEPARELLAIHTEIRDLLLDHFDTSGDETLPEEETGIDSAAVEIGREAHTMKADFKDVVKALFMWKDDPVERARNGDLSS